MPDGCIERQLVTYCASISKSDPQGDAIFIAATDLHSVATLIEPARLRKLAKTAFLVGSPTNHMFSNEGKTENTLTCPVCDRLVTTL